MWLISNTLKNFYISKLNPILNIPQIIFQIILPLPENSFYRLYFNYYYTSMNINTSNSQHSIYVICILSWKVTKNINISFSFTNNIFSSWEQSKSDVGGGFGWTMRFLLIYYNYSTSVLSTGLELGSVKLEQTNLMNTVWYWYFGRSPISSF